MFMLDRCTETGASLSSVAQEVAGALLDRPSTQGRLFATIGFVIEASLFQTGRTPMAAYYGKYMCPILTTSKWSLVRDMPFESSKRNPAEYGAIPEATQRQSSSPVMPYGVPLSATIIP